MLIGTEYLITHTRCVYRPMVWCVVSYTTNML